MPREDSIDVTGSPQTVGPGRYFTAGKKICRMAQQSNSSSCRDVAIALRALLFGSLWIEAGLSRTIQASATDPDFDACMIADLEHLVGAGLRLTVGPAADRESRRDLVCGVEKETVIFRHGLHDAARMRPFESLSKDEVGRSALAATRP
jgi:hypothetical protein